MKSLIQAVVVAAVLVAPIASFAQSNQPVTRAQVRAELVQLEKAGYNPSRSADTNYPSDILAAEARVAAQSDAAGAVSGVIGVSRVNGSGVGGFVSGSSEAGSRISARLAANDGMKPVYFGQ